MNATVPTISAIVTTFRRPKEVQYAVQSVLAQSRPPDEIIVVDDGSNADVQAWLQMLCDRRIRYVQHAWNKGLAAARNTGIRESTGDLIAFLDDDDQWAAERLQAQVALYDQLCPQERDRLGVIYCGAEVRNGEGKRLFLVQTLNEGNLESSIRTNGIHTVSSSTLFTRSALQTVGGFDERLASSIDHDIWMALAAAGYEVRTVHQPLVICYERAGRETMMTDTDRRIAGIRQFVEKWRPTFEAWHGRADARTFTHRYMARAIATLVAYQLASGHFLQAARALHALVSEGAGWRTGLSVFIRVSARGVARRLPSVAVHTRLKRALGR